MNFLAASTESKVTAGGPVFLLNPSDNGISGTSSVVFHGFSILEEFEGRITSDFEFFSQGTFFGGVNLSQFDGGVFFGQLSSSFSIFRSQGFTMSTPWSIKFN